MIADSHFHFKMQALQAHTLQPNYPLPCLALEYTWRLWVTWHIRPLHFWSLCHYLLTPKMVPSFWGHPNALHHLPSFCPEGWCLKPPLEQTPQPDSFQPYYKVTQRCPWISVTLSFLNFSISLPTPPSQNGCVMHCPTIRIVLHSSYWFCNMPICIYLEGYHILILASKTSLVKGRIKLTPLKSLWFFRKTCPTCSLLCSDILTCRPGNTSVFWLWFLILFLVQHYKLKLNMASRQIHVRSY